MYIESLRARVIESRIKFDIKKQRLVEILTTRAAHARSLASLPANFYRPCRAGRHFAD